MSTKHAAVGFLLLIMVSGPWGCATQNGTDEHTPSTGADTGGDTSTGGQPGDDGAATGGVHELPDPPTYWWQACTGEVEGTVEYSTDEDGCEVCRVLESEVEPEVQEMVLEGVRCGGPGFQLGHAWIGCGWVFTRAYGDDYPDLGTWEGHYRIVEPPTNLGGASSGSGGGGEGGLYAIQAVWRLAPEEPFECSFAVYQEDFPADCESWEHVCCPESLLGSECDQSEKPFE